MSNGANFPEEIVADILSRLPPKPLGRFRSVSRPWLTLLTDPHFIQKHLNIQKNHQSAVLLQCHPYHLHSVELHKQPPDNHHVYGSASIFRFDPPELWPEFWGSCDGLTLVSNGKGTVFLINPSTRECRRLPVSPFALDPFASHIIYGFGYDLCSDDYKVVTISFYDTDTDNEHEPDCVDMFVNVYTLKKNSWKRVRNSPFDHSVPALSMGVCFNGSVHWLVSRVSDHLTAIAAFDLADEEFREVAPPTDADMSNIFVLSLAVIGGCLCLVDSKAVQLDMWVMKECGVTESWSKLWIVGLNASSVPLDFLEGGEELLVIDEYKLAVYNAKEGRYKDIVIHGMPDIVEAWGSFVQSLVSPNCGVTTD